MDQETQKEGVEKKFYEVSFLARGEDDAARVSALLSQHGMDIAQNGGMRKIIPAYKITSDPHLYFGFYQVSAFPADIKSLEKDMGSVSGVVRSMILVLPSGRAAIAAKPYFRKNEDRPRDNRDNKEVFSGVLRGDGREQRAPEILSNEALEKKIEEILQ